jgi:hypothetical protein
MNYNDKNKNEDLQYDELNIKSHLNTSLDLSGISVSEDLINRTLAAIKEQSVSSQEEVTKTSPADTSKRVISWSRYIRGFAGVAAAVIIVVVGYNLVQQMPVAKKSANEAAIPEMATLAEDMDQKVAMQDTAAEESQAFDASVAMEAPKDIQYAITAEAGALEKRSTDSADGNGVLGSAGTGETELSEADSLKEDASNSMVTTQEFATADSRTTDDIVTYTFREIFIPEPAQAEYITITENSGGNSITLTESNDIEAFYILMDSYRFGTSDNSSLRDHNITVEMNSPELGTLYTMLVGRNLTVHYTQGENTVEMTYYCLEDTEFKHDLEEFYIEFSE